VPASFALRGTGMRYGTVAVLKDITLELQPRKMTALVGPNGAGKSTLLGILAGLRHGYGGQCFFDGVEIRDWERRAFARRVAYVPQNLELEFPFSGGEVVQMGRMPYRRGLTESPADLTAARRAMQLTDALDFELRNFRTLSGGERQRIVLASALAQEPEALLLDEPTTFLDLKHQIATYQLLRTLCAGGMLVVAVTHDLNLACAYCDRIVLLDRGNLHSDGPPAAVVTPDTLADVFEVRPEILTDPAGRPWIRYGD
jgi:iron complex transport system ATP-binding protein